MHQDQRIGLALGVLLIGACAALFFRNETREIASTPRLQRAQELDDRIAERSTRPYLKGIEIVEAADQARTRSISSQNEASDGSEDHVGSFWSPVESGTGKKLSQNSRGQRNPVAGFVDVDVEELEPIPVPVRSGTDREQAITSNQPAGRTAGSHSNQEATADSRLHLVQKGETLSSIAAKTLGSGARFREIFEANQDQLKDPNDLRVGMKLQIPSPNEVAALKPLPVPSHDEAQSGSETPSHSEAQAKEGNQSVANNQEAPTQVPSASRKFVPARRFTHLVKPFQSSERPE